MAVAVVGDDRVRRDGSRSRGRRGSGKAAHCEGEEKTRVPHRMPPRQGFGQAQTDSPPVLTVIHGFPQVELSDSEPS